MQRLDGVSEVNTGRISGTPSNVSILSLCTLHTPVDIRQATRRQAYVSSATNEWTKIVPKYEALKAVRLEYYLLPKNVVSLKQNNEKNLLFLNTEFVLTLILNICSELSKVLLF